MLVKKIEENGYLENKLLIMLNFKSNIRLFEITI